MFYGYVRVSTDKQTVENQKFEINRFCFRNKLSIDNWFEETISGTKAVQKRRLGILLGKVEMGDTIICSEISRLGRSLFMVMDILSCCMRKGVKVWTIKDNYRLGDDIQSKVLAFAFGLSAEIERNLISRRTKEALARRKAEGKILGRRPGKAKNVKLSGHEAEIERMILSGCSKAGIGRRFHVNRNTVRIFIRERMVTKYRWY
jgi:DNA invertase Pin-like site-specific DNA recombinase